MGDTLSPEQFARVRTAILHRGAAVAAPVALLVSGYFAVWQPVFGHYPWIVQLIVNVAESIGYLVLILVFGNVVLRHWLSAHEPWAVAGQPIKGSEREQLVNIPARAAGAIFTANVAALVFGAVINLVSGVNSRQTIGYLVGFFLLGFTFAVVVYLQTERALQPLYRLAFASSLPQRRIVGVRARLLVSWAVGSAVPLVFVAIIPVRPTRHGELPIVAPMLYMALGGLLVGAVTAFLSARSVTEPIEVVRRGLERVRDGDLMTAVEVTMPGALGSLQVGFNEMVDAVRSRRQTEDLFGRHVGEEVARHALESGVELGGELREASVVFVDLIGSTALAEKVRPQEVVGFLNSFFDAVVNEVAAEGGWVNKFEGDGCVCVFGAPTSYTDHPVRALRAARQLSSRLDHAGIGAGIGVSSGEVVAGNVGTSRRLEYTVIGRPVNEAARLSDAAKSTPTRLLATARMITSAGEEATNWCSRGAITLRGIETPVEVVAPKPDSPECQALPS